MKYSSALSLAMAPAALAKAVHNSYHARRENEARSFGNVANAEAAALALGGLTLGNQQDIVVIWVNQGAGAATQTLNEAVTVTQTVTAGGEAAAVEPPAATAPPAEGGATATPPEGASPVEGALTTHTVMVGGSGLQFQPAELKAAMGDMVVFQFMSMNHTATQSAFDTPCQIMEGGMDSGFQANPNNSVNPPPQVAMQVMVDTPLWFYCRQMGHCGKGMTFSINPTAEKTQAMFQSMAIAQNGAGAGSAITGNGGEAPPAEGGMAAPPAEGASSAAAGEAATSLAPLGGEGASATAAAGDASATLQPLGGEGGAAGSAGAGAAAPSGVATGTGTIGADGACSCVVSCANMAFPAVQAQGVGGFGGAGGAIPAEMVGAA